MSPSSSADNVVDSINRRTMRNAVAVYAAYSGLNAPEKAALACVASSVRGGRILDMGVGGGRTTPGLLELSADYVGIDYEPGMVESCRARFPGVRFEHADARAMPQFDDASFDLIVFAWAGICMVDHAGRLAILREVRRLLRPGGFFVFSTYNRDSVEHDRAFAFPEFAWSANPVTLLKRGAGFALTLARCVRNRLRLRPLEIRTADYSIINDLSHDYSTMLYYIALPAQRRQLEDAGFAADAIAFDGDGVRVEGATRHGAITFVAQG
jgi:SAM-dependent methyltransferase